MNLTSLAFFELIYYLDLLKFAGNTNRLAQQICWKTNGCLKISSKIQLKLIADCVITIIRAPFIKDDNFWCVFEKIKYSFRLAVAIMADGIVSRNFSGIHYNFQGAVKQWNRANWICVWFCKKLFSNCYNSCIVWDSMENPRKNGIDVNMPARGTD